MSEPQPARKRLVLCCDGTWDSADRGGAASNVVRMARSVAPVAKDGSPQIVYYHPGVGTGNGLDRLIGGATGVGLARNVRDAYAFIVNNFVRGDEIFLFGFSRGAYTARALSGLIDTIGVLREHQMGRFLDAWGFYRLPHRERQRHQAAFDQSFDDRIGGVPIRVVGVWDTVGSLGIPANRFLGRLPVCRANYRFLSVNLCPGVEHAFQALAIDEQRLAFAPAVWRRDPQAPPQQVLRQVWFSGVHADIGGGYAQHGAADLAFLWMAAQVAALLDLDCANIAAECDTTEDYQQATLHETRTGFWRALERPLHRQLGSGADEAVHRSVIERLDRPPAAGNAAAPYSPPQKTRIRQLPVAEVSPFEQQFAWGRGQPAVAPPPLFRAAETFCDRLVRLLGGG